MAGYPAGSVIAKIELDTGEFTESIKNIKTKIDDLKKTLSKNGLMDIDKQIQDLNSRIEDYKKQLKNLREENENLKKSNQNLAKGFKEEGTAAETASKKISKYISIYEKMTKFTNSTFKNNLKEKGRGDIFSLGTGRGKYGDFSAWVKGINKGAASVGKVTNKLHDAELKAQVTLETMKNAYFQYDRIVRESAEKERLYWLTRQSQMRLASEAYIASVRNISRELQKSFVPKQNYTPLGQVTQGYDNYIHTLSKVRGEFEKVNNVKFTKLSENIYKNGELILNMGKSWRIAQNEIYESTTLMQLGFKEVDGELVSFVENTYKVSEVLKTFNFKLLENVDASSKAYQNVIKLSSAIHKMNAQGTANWAGRQTVGGYSNYLSSITRINQALEKQASLEAKLKAQRLDQYYAKVNAATHKYWTQIRQGTITLNTYKSNLTQITKQLDQQTARTQRLATAQYRLFNQYHTNNLNYYKANMNEINSALEKQIKASNESSTATKKAGTSMNQTAHSGRILSNTLYQIRGALLSLKMIFTAMGGMALWGFASDLAQGVEETFRAKNEMEAVLRQNSKVSDNGIAFFNRQLDAMTDKFKKINKYSIGETVASIGLEFELNAQQMADSLDIVSMIQSEYVRAGRKEEEAALAVKDILQGEFQRLSRETGVGKEELIAYGWNGDKTDVESLMDALRKAALDRNWDVFAAKATSLNDVLTMTKSRFSEFGADLMQSSTPMIVGAFNGIIDAFEGLSSWFSKLGSFGQQLTLIGGGAGIFGGLLTALPMVTKHMGLLDIATIGWRKSILTAILNLNKAEVAQEGFRKALAATISGTKASELANVRWTKSIMGRVLGLNQSVLAEKGYLAAMVQSKAVMKGTNETLAKLSANTMSRSQKLAYLTTNIDLNTASSLKQGEAIKKVATSWRIWRAAILGVVGIALVSWLAAVSAQCKQTKENIDAFHKVVENGDTLLEKARKKYDDYGKSADQLKEKLNGLEKGTAEYNKTLAAANRASNNQGVVKGQVKDLEKATKLAKKYNYQIKQYGESISERKNDRAIESLQLAGLDYSKATERASGYADAVQAGYEAEIKAYKLEDHRLYQASQHINERIELMKAEDKAQAKSITDEKERAKFEKQTQEERIKYAQEYQAQAEKTAEHWKEFAKGNFNAGIYAVMDELTLIWIDLWNNTAFLNFWRGVEKTWSEIVPMANGLKDALIGVGEALANFYGTELGRNVINIIAFGTAIGLVSKKIAGWLGYSKSTVEALKTVGGKLKDAIKKWKGYGDAVDKAKKKESEGTVINQEGKVNKTPTSRGEWWQDTKGKMYQDATNYFRAAEAIAAAMLLVSEAILLLNIPMWSLAQTGKYFKSIEPNVREGIKGLQLIAPVMGVVLPPIIALMLITNKYAKQFDIITSFKASAELIAMGMLLTAEAILMLVAPMGAIAVLGWVNNNLLGNGLEKGKEAIEQTGKAIMSLAPVIPVFAAAIALGAIGVSSSGVGFIAEAIIIGGGMLAVSGAIASLIMPMAAIAFLGSGIVDVEGVKQGSEAIKLTAEALKYVEEAMASLTLIDLNLFAQTVTDLVAKFLGVDLGSKLTELTGEGGVLQQLSDFTKAFNSADIEIEAIDQAKVETLANAGDGFNTIADAMKAVNNAMENLPEEFKNGGSGTPALTYNAETDKTSVNVGEATNYFDAFKEPIKQLSTFVNDFNESEELNVPPIDTAKVEAINTTANGISSINSAIQNVKTAIGSSVDAQWAGNVASGGLIGAAIGLLAGDGNPQASGLKSGLDELYLSVKDIMDFNTKINGLTSEGSGDTSNIQNASNMVSALQTQINNVKTTLDGAIPTIKNTAKGMGGAIVTGFQSGMSNLSSTVNTTLDGVSSTFTTKGNSWGDNLSNGFKDHFKIKDIASTEISNTLDALSGKDQEFYDKGYALGDAFQRGYKDGGGINSPGYAAQAMQGELGYMSQYINDAMGSIPQLAGQLAQNVSKMLSPSFDLSNLQFPDLSQWTTNLTSLIPTVTNVKTQVSSSFTNMSTNVGQSLTGIANNAKSKYSSILSTTRTSLGGMQSATTKNIGQIRTSWKGMQDALIASAEHIKTQTGSKINTLRKNMGDFWNKIKHPDQLISGAAGGHTGTIRRRYVPHGNYAGGGTISRSQSLFKPKGGKGSPADLAMEYVKCLFESGSPCFAGGWNFNWTPSIASKFKGWNTHFSKYHLDDFLNVGKFENNNFPVKGNKDLAKQYIFDVIRATTYGKYFNSKFGEDPVAALRAGVFNCWDGTNIVLAIARAFGFEGSRGHGTWNGIGHVWANIPGLGIIDPTAIQNQGSFTSSAVRGYSAGSIRRGQAKSKLQSENNNNTKNVTYKSEVHVHGNIYGVEDLQREMDKACERNNKKLFTNSLSGV